TLTVKTVAENPRVTVESFLNFLEQKKKLSQTDKEVSLIAVGDISYSRAVGRVVKKQNNINYPLLKIQDYLKTGDIVFGNLETPITAGRDIVDFEMVFRSNPGTETALKQSGFSILSLANNHTPNFGNKGLMDTMKYLDSEGIKHIGAGKDNQEANQPVFIEVKGIKFAFLAYNDSDVVPASYEGGTNHPGTAFMRVGKMSEAVKEVKTKADYVIVSMHSGTEYVNSPNDSQKNFAHGAIDAGADIIIGHHPHVVQTVEQYKGKYIFYSLGNFVFDQPQSSDTKEGLTVKVNFSKSEIGKISLVPIAMENFAQPTIPDDIKTSHILARLNFPYTNEISYLWNASSSTYEEKSSAVIDKLNISKSKVVTIKTEQADLNKNSIKEIYILKDGQLIISEGGKMVWQSPVEWWIDNFILADANNDGLIDINLAVWKAGNFGTSKPVWVKENDMSIKNHFFVFDYIKDEVKPIWQSSNLEAPNCEFAIKDVNGDGKNELVATEGDYSQKPNCNGKYVAIWTWNGWGFSNEWRSNKGNYNNLEIESKNGDEYIVAE
ncbi:MAG: CapA family protein, partial [bacterium]